MRIYLDETDLVLRQLRKLYHTLPLDLRTEKSLIPASELIVEAIEYITYMKEEADRPHSDEENNNKSKIIVEPIIIKHSPIEPALKTLTASVANPFLRPYGRTPLSTQKLKTNTSQSHLFTRTSVQTEHMTKEVPVTTNLTPRSLPHKVILRPTHPLQSQSKPITIQTSTGRLISIAPIIRPGLTALSSSIIRLPPGKTPGYPPPIQPQSLLTPPGPKATKPITIITKNSSGKDTPITIFTAGPNLAPGIGDKHVQDQNELVLNYDSNSGKISMDSPVEPVVKAPRPHSEHGLICPYGCECPHSQDQLTLTEKFKEKLFKYMTSRLKILNRDSETCLTYNWIQEGVFEKLLMICRRSEFFKFCRIVGPNSDDPADQAEKDSCIILEKTVWEDPNKRGCIRVNGKLFCLPLLLVKLFRDGFGEFPLTNLSVFSKPNCYLSRGIVQRTSSLCINPSHYIYDSVKDGITTDHHCSLRIRADTANGVKVVCVLCKSVVSYKPSANANNLTIVSSSSQLSTTSTQTAWSENLTIETLSSNSTARASSSNSPAGVLSANSTLTASSPSSTVVSFLASVMAPVSSSESAPLSTNSLLKPLHVREEEKITKKTENKKNDESLELSVKTESVDIEDVDYDDIQDPTLNAMEDAFEGMLRTFEQSVDEEAKQSAENASQGVLKQEMVEREDDEARLQIEIQNEASTEIKDLSRLKRSSSQAGLAPSLIEKKKILPRFQCWKCLEWKPSKEVLANHSCLSKISLSCCVYVCKFCGFCSEMLPLVRCHVVKCKIFRLLPLPILNNFKSLRDNDDVSEMTSGDSLSRAKRQKKTDKLKCEECGITFAASTELILHTEKVKCKSIQCDVCNQFFANARTHQNHSCEIQSTQVTRIPAPEDENILVVKTDRDKLSQQPVKCLDCGNLVQSYDVLRYHQSTPVSCHACKSMFINSCKLLRHNCTIKHFQDENESVDEKVVLSNEKPQPNSSIPTQFISVAKNLHKISAKDVPKNIRNSPPPHLNKSEKLLSAFKEEPNSSTNSIQQTQFAISLPGSSDSVKLIKITKLVGPYSGKLQTLRKVDESPNSGQAVPTSSEIKIKLSRPLTSENDAENLPLSRRKIKPSKFL